MKIIIALLIFFLSSFCFTEENVTFKLANNLFNNKLYDLAAVEFQRAYYLTDDINIKNEYILYSAFSYYKSSSYSNALNVLDEFSISIDNNRQLNYWKILSAEINLKLNSFDEANYYLDMLQDSPDKFNSYYLKRKTQLLFNENNFAELKDFFNYSSHINYENAFHEYSKGNDKNPVLGGFLGIIPGLGYAYSGEYANALRSLILNSLFIYGMKDTARKDQWGAFAIITFFELTWYSGSIYGGIDSAHRYNKKRKDNFLDNLKGSLYLDFDSSSNNIKPSFKLKIEY